MKKKNKYESDIVEWYKRSWEKEEPKPLVFEFETTGAPDFLVLRDNGEAWFYEFKRPGGKLRPRQKVIIPILKKMGYKVAIIDGPPKEKK